MGIQKFFPLRENTKIYISFFRPAKPFRLTGDPQRGATQCYYKPTHTGVNSMLGAISFVPIGHMNI